MRKLKINARLSSLLLGASFEGWISKILKRKKTRNWLTFVIIERLFRGVSNDKGILKRKKTRNRHIFVFTMTGGLFRGMDFQSDRNLKKIRNWHIFIFTIVTESLSRWVSEVTKEFRKREEIKNYRYHEPPSPWLNFQLIKKFRKLEEIRTRWSSLLRILSLPLYNDR